jgi:hypothetical protein
VYAKAFLILCAVLATRRDQLDLGAWLSKSQIPESSNIECVATPSQTYSCALLTIEGVRISVGYDEKTLAHSRSDNSGQKVQDSRQFAGGHVEEGPCGRIAGHPGWEDFRTKGEERSSDILAGKWSFLTERSLISLNRVMILGEWENCRFSNSKREVSERSFGPIPHETHTGQNR